MIFEKRVETIQEVLYTEYEITEKINKNDWADDANEMALLISNTDNEELALAEYENYLVMKFKDDTYTDFKEISKKILNAINAA